MKAPQKRKALFVILAVSALTLYNILPTIFFYSNSLNSPIEKEKALETASSIAERVNKLEQESIEWINSYCNLLKIKPSKVSLKTNSPETINVTFETEKEARVFRSHTDRAGNLIPFFPKRIIPYEETSAKETLNTKSVDLKREIPIHFDTSNLAKYFSYVEMRDKQGVITSDYRNLLDDRVLELCRAVTAERSSTSNIERALTKIPQNHKTSLFLGVAETILQYKNTFSKDEKLLETFYASFFNSKRNSKKALYEEALKGLRASKDLILQEKVAVQGIIAKQELDKSDNSISEVATLKSLRHQEGILLDALTILQNKKTAFIKAQKTTELSDYLALLKNSKIDGKSSFTLSTGLNNPIITSINVDYKEDKVLININPQLIAYRDSLPEALQRKANQLIYDEIAKVKGSSGENIEKIGSIYTLDLTNLQGAKSLLKLDLQTVALDKANTLKKSISKHWARSSNSLSKENYEIVSYNDFQKLNEQDKHFKLAIYSPVLENGLTPEGFSDKSIYVIGKDLLLLYEKLSSEDATEEASNLSEDLVGLQRLLARFNARTYSGASYPFDKEFENDIIYEIPDFAGSLLAATRENFKVTGSGKNAVLEFNDVKGRILTLNEIDNKEHADLLKWKDDYNQSRVNPNSEGYMSIPAPTKSTFFSNLALSTTKYFRGDDRKIIHWGLDLNGGTTVRVALKDKQNKAVTSEADINQGVNELYRRVNKMGVSDVTIRKAGPHITLDFPATQTLSASELITSSSMTFHIVNEKFSMHNPKIGHSIQRFLQEVWNEALVTNKTDAENINKIAFNHLYGEALDKENAIARSDAGRVLLDNGLNLADPDTDHMSSEFNDKISKIGVLDGDSYQDWYGSSNPLMILFNNYALEGASLNSVQSGYDPTTGNYLSFTINASSTDVNGKNVDPRNILHNWTSVFSTSQMDDVKYSQYTAGNGWRLSAILNGKIISMPRLQDALKDSGRISGSFTQKEVARLAADLRAGSLTYTPEIISETTISPELGAKERSQGIFAMAIAFVAVLALMIAYYRFAGVIASIAVIFNILIIWAALQNLGASLTLPGIAGIILTIGMAVDANVLIFERIREEHKIHDNLGKAIEIGYKKAFTAIFDSNITTIIAAVILLNFDAGPVRGFALTLIIGIVSSMFTALYMTRTFFNFWYKKEKNQSLKMLNLIPNSGLSFMKYGKIATVVAAAVITVGTITLVEQRKSIFGMDFTGGMSLEVEVSAQNTGSTSKELVAEAFSAAGIPSADFSIRELNTPNNLKIFLSNSLNNAGRPFADLPRSSNQEYFTYSYEKNPRLKYVVDTLKTSGVSLTSKSLDTLDKNFTNVSGQMSETMRNNAVFGLLLALAAILVYITIRFEFTYAISATIGLAFDLLLTLAILGICKAFGMSLSIDLNTIAALMTIIGYSLNDTIIVFDRIRSDIKVKKTTSLKEVINLALNKTLSRTIMTSLTTLVVLLSLVILGGKSIFNFSFLMMVGVIVGTLSTLFIASTFLLLFRGKETKKSHSASIVSISS